MSDSLNSIRIVEADDVSPDTIKSATEQIVRDIEASLERRSGGPAVIAANWNQTLLTVEPLLNGDAKVSIRVPVL